MTITIRPLAPADRPAWEDLYAGYAAFYQVTQTPDMRARTFDWLMDEGHDSNALVAEDADGMLIGLAHYRPYPSPLSACVNGFLDDLFVTPASRGSGAADALIEALAAIGRDRGWQKIRWMTADNNYRGRGVYDKHATRTMWLTYELLP
jgi:GNAT superfamily N-acetyltransferase